MIWAVPHEGYAYDEDNREVYHIYKDVMIDTDGWTWLVALMKEIDVVCMKSFVALSW
jgi:hypothetical protein